MKPIYSLAKVFFNALFYTLHKHKVYGVEHIQPGPAIIAANHASYYDPPLIGVSCQEEVHYLAEGSLFQRALFRAVIRSLNAHPVVGGAYNLSSLKVVADLLKAGDKVVIFPEGSRSWNGTLAPLKSGIGMLVMRNQCSVIPTYIHGTYDVWNRMRFFPLPRGKTACVFGSPISWTQFQDMPRKDAYDAVTKRVEESIRALRRWYEEGAEGLPP